MKNYKHIRYLLYLLFIFNTAISQEFWEVVNTPPDVNNIHSIETNNGDIYIGVSYTAGGGLYRTSDNGLSWELLGFENQGIDPIEINELEYIYAYAGLGGNPISRSVDNGLTWEIVHQSMQGGYSMNSFPGGLMFACGGPSNYVNLIRSVDYGDTWEEVFVFSPTEYPHDIEIQNKDTIYMGVIGWTGGGGVYRSIDGGDTWENIGLKDHYVSSLAMNSAGDLFAGVRGHYSQDKEGVYVLPKGETEWVWIKQYDLVTSLVINSKDEIYIGCSSLTYDGGVRYSSDNGQTWQDISLETMHHHDIESLALDSEGYLFAIEYYSDTPLYKSVNSTLISSQDIQSQSCTTYNYPNPFADETTIYFELPLANSHQAEINIYDISDHKIEQIKCPIHSGEKQSVKWHANGLPAGIYYYELSAGSIHTFKKMVLQK